MEQKLKKEDFDGNISKSVKKRVSKRKHKTNSVLLLISGIILGTVLGFMIAFVLFEKEENASEIDNKKNNQQQEESINYMEQMLEEKGFTIETPIVDLAYPEKWSDYVKVEQIEGDSHTVKFFATVEEREDLHIFDIVFGGNEGYTLGYITEKSGEQIAVNIITYDYEFGKEWNEDEQNIIYAMLEDVNYIIGMLQKENNFTINK